MNCRFVQVCVQLPTSAVNVSLLVLAAERRAATPCCGATAPGSPTAAALVRYLLPARRSAANPPHATAAVERREERRTYARPFHRPCFPHYATSVNKLLIHCDAPILLLQDQDHDRPETMVSMRLNTKVRGQRRCLYMSLKYTRKHIPELYT